MSSDMFTIDSRSFGPPPPPPPAASATTSSSSNPRGWIQSRSTNPAPGSEPSGPPMSVAMPALVDVTNNCQNSSGLLAAIPKPVRSTALVLTQTNLGTNASTNSSTGSKLASLSQAPRPSGGMRVTTSTNSMCAALPAVPTSSGGGTAPSTLSNTTNNSNASPVGRHPSSEAIAKLPASPLRSSYVPPPPPLVQILSAHIQQRKDLEDICTMGAMANAGTQLAPLPSSNNTGGEGMQPVSYRSVPPPPPVHSPQPKHESQQANNKFLVKYHFLKNYAVKPKTPSSMDKRKGQSSHQQQGGGRRRTERTHEVSPLPVAPAMPSQQSNSPKQLPPHLAQDPSQTSAFLRNIPQLASRPPANFESPKVAEAPPPAARRINTLNPVEATSGVSATIATPNAQKVIRRHTSAGGPIVSLKVHPLPKGEKEVARNLMEDIVAATPEPASHNPRYTMADDVEGVTYNDCGLDEVKDDDIRRSEERNYSPVGRNRRDGGEDDTTTPHRAGSATFALPSPTTLGSETGSQAMCDQSPQTLNSTAKGSEVLDIDFDEDVSPMSDEPNPRRERCVRDDRDYSPRSECEAVVFDDELEDDRYDTTKFQAFFASNGLIEHPETIQAEKYLTESRRIMGLLQRNYMQTIVLAMFSADSDFGDLFRTCVLEPQANRLEQQLQHVKLHMTFDHWYNEVVAIDVAMPFIESQGRRVVLMQRDLFMRAAVRKFVRTRPTVRSPRKRIPGERTSSNGFESLRNRHQRYMLQEGEEGSQKRKKKGTAAEKKKARVRPISPQDETQSGGGCGGGNGDSDGSSPSYPNTVTSGRGESEDESFSSI